MSTTVTYKGNTIATLTNETKRLNTAGTWLEADVVITDANSSSSGGIIITEEANETGITAVITADNVTTLTTKSITQNGTYSASSDNADGYSSVTVNVSGGSPSATQHTIHLEFTDSTDTDIDVYYDDALLGAIITAYMPTTYGAKTVDSAALDNVVWYQRPSETWETVFNDSVQSISDTPYNYFWIAGLSDVYPTAGSVWRITINNTEYRCTAYFNAAINMVCIGNPLYSDGTDDGSGTPFNFYNAGWGAWVGDTEIQSGIPLAFKVERLVTA